MTDIDRAEEYCNNEVPFDTTENGENLYTENDLKYAYLAGLKAARKEMWHDLRENSNDLPEDCVINQDGKRVLYDHINKVWRNDDADEYICDDPIAWCDIPTFEE